MADFEKAYHLVTRNPVVLVNRVREITDVRYWVVSLGLPLVGVVGEPGIGKTAFAYQFIRRMADYFPGGTHYMLPNKGVPTTSHERSLVVLDDADTASPEQLQAYLNTARPGIIGGRQLILVSRKPLLEDYPHVVLGPLEEKDLIDLFRSMNLKASPTEEQLLAALSYGLPSLARILSARTRDVGLEAALKELSDFIQPGSVDSAGHAVDSSVGRTPTIASELVIAGEDVLKELDSDPTLLHRLTPREFEQLVAELLHRQGYEVELTPLSKDGGKDVYVAHKSGLGSALYVVQAKKYRADRPVGIGVVRELYGVVQAEHLTGGIVATTSYFTKGAVDFQESVQYQMSLTDYHKLREWLASALGRPSGAA